MSLSPYDSPTIHRLTSSKRKHEDIAPFSDDEEDDEFDLDLVSVNKMRKEDSNTTTATATATAVNSSAATQQQSFQSFTNSGSGGSGTKSVPSCSYKVSSPNLYRSVSRIQFFVRMISEGNTMVISANADDTIQSIHERIRRMTGIPVAEQRLIYRGRQLQLEQTLSECAIENDAGLQLVGRMRSTDRPAIWQLIDDMVTVACRLYKGQSLPKTAKSISSLMASFLDMTLKDENEVAIGHLQVFSSSSAPAALVMLYMSQEINKKEFADNAIKLFLTSGKTSLPKNLHSQCAIVVLEFCKLLKKISDEDPLYLLCRHHLGLFLEGVGISHEMKSVEEGKGLLGVQEIFPFVTELATRLSKDLALGIESNAIFKPSSDDVRDFALFLFPLRNAIMEQVGLGGPISLPLTKKGYNHSAYGEEIAYLHTIFCDLLNKMDNCLAKMETLLHLKGLGECNTIPSEWSHYLTILKELNGVSKLYQGAEEKFWMVLKKRKTPLCALIVKCAKRTNDHRWILECKGVTNFESRRHLAMMLFPEVREDYEELYEMLIDRSNLLNESFEYIQHAEPEALHGGLFMEFKNEEATGPGVLREWFYLVCQALFNQQNALFVSCPHDRRRFFPNPASKVNPLHLEYLSFSGRVIALALMHKVQVGVVFDRVFFLQLAGLPISLEDIRDADPCLHDSCKKILEMDAAFIDSDALGLTFVREAEELGSRTILELCPGGKDIVVNSNNREQYVNLLVQNQFVTSIADQVSHFAQGFADIVSSLKLQRFFFQSLELEDLDWMLYGSNNAICVEDWKAHTDFNGFLETDPQTTWFWKIVGDMSAEHRKVLLFFWTSVKYLPVEGFGGLASRLAIYRSMEPHDRLPSSHTCFYRLCFPAYPSMAVMRERLNVITQEHVGCSFGIW